MLGNPFFNGALVLFGLSGFGFAQAESVRGKVLDPARVAIAGAQIAATGGASTTSNALGEFSLDLAAGGPYTLKIVADGFAELSDNLNVPTEPREFILQPMDRYTVTVVESGTYRTDAIQS